MPRAGVQLAREADEQRVALEHGDFDLPGVDPLLDEDLEIVAEGIRQRRLQAVPAPDLMDADAGAHVAGLDEDRQREPLARLGQGGSRVA